MRIALALLAAFALTLAGSAAAIPDLGLAPDPEPRVVTLCLLGSLFDPMAYPGCVAAGLTCIAMGYWHPLSYGVMCLL